jgi:uncharacterized membrane protein
MPAHGEIVVRSGPLGAVARHRFLLLFLFLLGSLVLYPFAEGSSAPYWAFRIVGSAVILVSIYAVSLRRGLVILGLLLAVPAIVQHVLYLRADAGLWPVANIFFSFVFDLLIIVVMFRRVFSRDHPDAETIFGALCIYLLTGFGFARLYGMIARIHAHAFFLDPQTNLHAAPDRFDFVYFSFATMTGLGAAGITAVSPMVRSISVMQSILGVLYLAVLISRLMGAYRVAVVNVRETDGASVELRGGKL